MRLFLQAITLLFFLNSSVFAIDFKDMKKIYLKKDEQKKILVKYGTVEKLFKFRWTLYANGGLVVLRSYDKIVSQNILYLRNRNASFRFYLMPNGITYGYTPYILVKFKEFDYESGRALFELYISDRNMQVMLEYLN